MKADIIKYLKRLQKSTKDKHVKYHIKCGLHSNIPPCCILFFVAAFSEAFDSCTKKKKPIIYNKIKEKVFKERGFRFYYQPCPSCLFKAKPKKVKSCDCKYEK